VRLTPLLGSPNPITLSSQVVPLGVTVPPTARIFATVAAVTTSPISNPQICVYGYSSIDGSGAAVTSACNDVSGDSSNFKVNFVHTPTVAGLKSVKAQLRAVGPTANPVDFDDPKVSVIC
jgi:hypothetical protein